MNRCPNFSILERNYQLENDLKKAPTLLVQCSFIFFLFFLRALLFLFHSHFFFLQCQNVSIVATSRAVTTCSLASFSTLLRHRNDSLMLVLIITLRTKNVNNIRFHHPCSCMIISTCFLRLHLQFYSCSQFKTLTAGLHGLLSYSFDTLFSF